MNTETEATKAEPREVMNAEQVADFLGVDVDYVYRAAAKLELPSVKQGRRTLFLRSSLLEHLKKNERGGK